MATQLPAETLLYLWTCPGTADFGYLSPEEFGARVGATKALPENLRRVLVSDESADKIQKLALWKHRLPLNQAQTVARIIGRILRGEESGANVPALLQENLAAPPHILADISQSLTREFITPNYFQIAQVYEKRHKEVGSRQEAVGSRASEPRAVPPEIPPVPKPTAPGRVVDLRNGPIPSRLPPPPREVPKVTEWGPPRVAPPIEQGEAKWGPPRVSPPLGPAPGTPQQTTPAPPTPRGPGGEGPPPPPVAPRREPPPPVPPSPAPPVSPAPAAPLESGAPAAPPEGPTADELLEKLRNDQQRPPRPSPPSPPPAPPGSGGTHGPLPPPPRGEQ